jgi:DNA helicase-2/ATP-dependent DNA helicase PcrA
MKGDEGSSSVPANTMNSVTFLELVSRVLKDIGRDELQEGSAQQRIITIEPTDRVLQILAGPGSGKTEMLVWRVLYDSFVLGVPSQRVMVTTFTRRAATELQVRLVERSDALLNAARKKGLTIPDPKVHDLRVGTIHSLCDTLLSEFDTNYLEGGTQLIDEAEVSVRIARDHRFKLGYANPPNPPRVLNRLLSNPALTFLFRPAWDDSPNWPSSMMERVSCILWILNQHIETWIPRCSATGMPNGIELVHGPKGQLTDDLVKLQQRWEAYLDEHHIQDFATIQKRFLERQKLIAEHITHVFVDEFQDNNPIQFAIHTGWLNSPNMRLTVVGDDDQAIYRFRGSDIECFNRLEPYCKFAKIPYRLEKLEINYRSTGNIVNFTQRFRSQSVLGSLSMPKEIRPAPKANPAPGRPVARGLKVCCKRITEIRRRHNSG